MSKVLVHHGILGQKWGVRRYQNKDGTLTDQGKERQKKNNNKQKLMKHAGSLIAAALVVSILKKQNPKMSVLKTINPLDTNFSADEWKDMWK